MKTLPILPVLVALLVACTSRKANTDVAAYTTIDYLEVARLFRDSIKTFPTVIDISGNGKRLIFIGTAHTTQITHQADTIENIFNRFQPDLAFNEGGTVEASRHYTSRNEAIEKAAETGELKFLCDKTGIAMVNGDLEDSTEWSELFKRHPRSEVLLYMSNERFIDLYAKGWIDTTAGVQVTYEREFIDYYTKRNITFLPEEKQFDTIRKYYRAAFGTNLDIHHMPADKFYFLSDGGNLCALGRSSKEIRDKALLTKLEKAFATHDKILVVFGGAHAIALRPALYQLMTRVY